MFGYRSKKVELPRDSSLVGLTIDSIDLINNTHEGVALLEIGELPYDGTGMNLDWKAQLNERGTYSVRPKTGDNFTNIEMVNLGIEAAIGLYLDNFLNAEVIAESK